MNNPRLVDGYNDFCWGPRLLGEPLSQVHLPRPSTRRRWRRSARKLTSSALAAATLCAIAVIVPPLTIASATTHVKLPPPPNTIHHARVIGNIIHPKLPRTCTPSVPPLPAPSTNTLAYLAESTTNEVQIADESTGALVGTPITVGTNPKGITYWNPPPGSSADPLVVATNSGSHSATIIDAITQSVVSTVTLPGGSGAVSVAASPTEPYAIAVDTLSGKVSMINLATDADAGELTLTSTASALSTIAFASNGSYAYVTDPSEHKIFVLEYTGGTAPYFTEETTYTNSSLDPTGIATDLTSSSSSTLLVTDAQSSSGHLLQFSDASGTLSSPTTLLTFSSQVPGAVSISTGSTYGYVAFPGTRSFDQVPVASPTSYSAESAPSGFGAIRSMGLSADGSTLMVGDNNTGSVQEWSTSAQANTNSTSADASVWAIAAAYGPSDSWDVYATSFGGNDIQVVNTGTDSVVQTIADSNGPEAVATSPDGQYVYVANADSVSVIQTSLVGTTENPIVATITGIQGSLPNTPGLQSIAVSPSGDAVIVTDTANGAVEVIDTNAADSSTYYRHVVARIGLLGGTHSTVVNPSGNVVFSADGLYAYVTESQDSGGDADDGVAVLQMTSSTTTGYSYDATDEALTQHSTTMILPADAAVDPNGESLYVVGTDSAEEPSWGLYKLPIGTNGQVSNGSTTVSPVWSGIDGYGAAFSPEDDSAFMTNTASFSVASISEAYDNTSWTSSASGWTAGDAVSPDGLYVAASTHYYCDEGENTVDLYDAGSGTLLAAVPVSSWTEQVAFAPQSSPRTITTSELASGASNPAESAVSAGMNDVVSSGTPSDAPGASAGVDTATGAYSMSVDSMTIPDIGPSLDMTASYDSSRASDLGLLGYGWTYDYGMTAAQNSHSASTNPCAIVVTQAGGATVTFFPSAEGPYSTCPASGYNAPGWAQATLTFQSSCNGSDSCYIVKLDGMTKYSIDETTGQLVAIKDLNGNTVTITWGSHTACSGATSSEPCQVTAADGIRTLNFSYPSAGSGTCPSGSYTCVVVSDPLEQASSPYGRTLTYVLNSSDQLVQISLADEAETATYVLTYNSSDDLTSWWDPNNNANDSGNTSFATDVTYTSGKVTQVNGPEIYSVAPLSTTPITPTTTFTYDDVDNVTGNGTVLIQNPDYNQSVIEPGANETLDTYAGFQLVSSVVGFGPTKAYYSGSTPPVVPINPSESASPLRDDFTLMPSESMNALAGTTEAAVGSQDAQYDNGVVQTTFDAHGNVLSTTDEQGDTTTNTYNGLNEVVTSTDALGNETANIYNSTGQLLISTTPPKNEGSSNPETSNYYNSNGTICANRDPDQVAAFGTLSSCVSAGSNATSYSYDSSGDVTLTTATDSSTQTSTTQDEYDANGNVCATLNPDGYAITGDRLSSCPTTGAPYATATISRDVYGNTTESESSLAVTPSDAFAIGYTCLDLNGNTTALVGPMGSAPSCPDTSFASSADTSFNVYDSNGDLAQSIAPLASNGTQGPTTTSQFDANGSSVLSLSADGYVVWSASHSVTLTPYETGTMFDDQGNQVDTAPEADLTSTCEADVTNTAPGSPPSTICPDNSVSAYDTDGQTTHQVTSGNGESGSTAPLTTTTTNNPAGTDGGDGAEVGGGTSGVSETAQQTFDSNGNSLSTTSEHWNGSSWVTDSSSSTAYAPDGSACWTSPSTVSSPSCSSPPGGTATVDYFDAEGNMIAEVGPGGAGTIEPGGACNPLTAVITEYTINTSDLCSFTSYYAYDEAGHQTESIGPSVSNSTSIGVAAGVTTTYGYDPSGNQTTLVNAASNTVTSAFNAANERVGITYSDESTTNCTLGSANYDTCYSFNADGTRSQMVDSTGTSNYSYNDAGEQTSVTDSNGNTVTYGYDALEREDCISYPGFLSSDSCVNHPDNGTNTIDSGEVWYSYDVQGRLSTLIDWNSDAFTYAYDCTGDVAWLAETPSSQIPSVTPCAGASGAVPASPVPSSGGTTYLVTTYPRSSGASGNLPTSQATAAVTSSGSSSLLEFTSLAYDDNNDLTSSTPKVSGTTDSADTHAYDSQQRVTSGPETSGSKTAYSYVNSGTGEPYQSNNTVDQMGIDAMPEPGTTAQLGAEYAGSGELCWVGEVTSTSGSCGSPSATNYETMNYNGSGELTGASAHGYGSNSSMTWNVDLSELTCDNPSGTTCTGPSSTQPAAQTYTYDADGLRMTARAWDGTTAVTNEFSWSSGSLGLLSDGTFEYLYGLSSTTPIAQMDTGDGVTGELLTDGNSNFHGLVEVTGSATAPFVLDNSSDYDTYGNPITASGGALNPGGLTKPVGTDPDSSTRYGFGGGYQTPAVSSIWSTVTSILSWASS